MNSAQPPQWFRPRGLKKEHQASLLVDGKSPGWSAPPTQLARMPVNSLLAFLHLGRIADFHEMVRSASGRNISETGDWDDDLVVQILR